MKNTYEVEVTDTFGGEANYSWVRRYTYKAKSVVGAIRMLAREYNAGWRKEYSSNDLTRYNLKGANVCAFVECIK